MPEAKIILHKEQHDIPFGIIHFANFADASNIFTKSLCRTPVAWAIYKRVKQKQRVLASFGTEEMLYEPNIWLKLLEINLKMRYLAKYLGNVL